MLTYFIYLTSIALNIVYLFNENNLNCNVINLHPLTAMARLKGGHLKCVKSRVYLS